MMILLGNDDGSTCFTLRPRPLWVLTPGMFYFGDESLFRLAAGYGNCGMIRGFLGHAPDHFSLRGKEFHDGHQATKQDRGCRHD